MPDVNVLSIMAPGQPVAWPRGVRNEGKSRHVDRDHAAYETGDGVQSRALDRPDGARSDLRGAFERASPGRAAGPISDRLAGHVSALEGPFPASPTLDSPVPGSPTPGDPTPGNSTPGDPVPIRRPAIRPRSLERDRMTMRPHSRALPLRVGTRGSPLALVQTRFFLHLLTTFCPVLRGMSVFEEHAIRTTGDRVQDRPLADIGGKGLFAKEIHEALADGRVDFAVHSLKDLETELPSGIVLACTLKREDSRDALILGPGCGTPDPAAPFDCLPAGARGRHLLGPAPGAVAARAAGSDDRRHPRQCADAAGQGRVRANARPRCWRWPG